MSELDLHDFCRALGFDGSAEKLLLPYWATLLEHTEGGIPHFMKREYYAHYYPLCNGPDGALERMDIVASMLEKHPAAARYASMLRYGLYVAEPQMPLGSLPALESIFGEYAPVFTLMVVLSSAELSEKAYARLGLPYQYFVDVSDKIGSDARHYSRYHNGNIGYRNKSAEWTRLEVDGKMFRLGRLEFVPSTWTTAFPAVYRSRKTGAYVSLCGDGWFFDARGLRIGKQSEAAFTSHLEMFSGVVVGTPLSADGFPVMFEMRSLDMNEWESALSPWDLVLEVHIPTGAPLIWESIQDAFRKAKEFFPKYFHKEVKAFKCSSWLMNPNIGKAMEGSNISVFQKHVHMGPNNNNPRAGLLFVYGNENADPLTEPAVTSLQRLFRQFRQDDIPLIWGNMFVMADEIE